MRIAVAVNGKGQVVVARVEVAQRFRERALGLIGRRGLAAGRGLLIPRCGSVHTCFMGFPLDLVFLDAEGRVTRVVSGVRPGRFAGGGRGARSVLEVASGWLDVRSLAQGERLTFADADVLPAPGA